MPYIDKKRRKELSTSNDFQTIGEANYIVTRDYIIPVWTAKRSYSTIAYLEEALVGGTYGYDWQLESIKGILEKAFTRGQVASACRLAFLEFYRRVGSKLEDKKAKLNGDVYRGVL